MRTEGMQVAPTETRSPVRVTAEQIKALRRKRRNEAAIEAQRTQAASQPSVPKRLGSSALRAVRLTAGGMWRGWNPHNHHPRKWNRCRICVRNWGSVSGWSTVPHASTCNPK